MDRLYIHLSLLLTYPLLARVLEETGGKAVVMELMSHENPDVRYQALTAVQKIMMNSL